MTKQKQAIPYIRFSSFKQSEGNSYQRQREAIDRWLAAHPDYVKSNLVFEDLAKSGFSSDEKKKYKQSSGMLKIQETIKAGLIRPGDCILVEAFDRATRRSAGDASMLVLPILNAGIDIVTLDDGVIYTKESLNGGLYYLLVAKIQAAHGYSKILSERVSASYDLRRKEAKEGKQVKRNVPLWLNPDGTSKDNIVVAVQEAFNLYIQGMGVHSIAVELKKRKIEELEKVSGPTVAAWLRNKAAIGIWANTEAAEERKREEIPDAYPAIVEKERFFLVQKLIEQRKTAKPTKTGKANFLSGLVVCSHCNSTMIVHNTNGKPNAFRCLSHHRNKELGCGNNKSIPYNLVLYIYLCTAFSGLQRALQKQTLSTSEKRKIVIEEQLSVVSRNIGKLIELDMLDLPETKDKLLALKEEREKLLSELASIDAGAVVESEIKQAMIEEKNLLESSPAVLNAMLKSADYKIITSMDGSIECTEDDKVVWRYAGVQRLPKSNVTDYYKLMMTHKATGREWVCKIEPGQLSVDAFPLLDTMQSKENDWLSPRYANILRGHPVEIVSQSDG